MSPAYKRWYDHDPKLLEVIELLKNYQDELKEHAVVFLDKLEQKVSKEALDRFYDLVEILRVVPPEVQSACAERFINALKEMGIEYESPNHS